MRFHIIRLPRQETITGVKSRLCDALKNGGVIWMINEWEHDTDRLRHARRKMDSGLITDIAKFYYRFSDSLSLLVRHVWVII